MFCRPDGGLQFTGAYAVNNDLQKAKRIFEGELFGPESFALDKDGTGSCMINYLIVS